MYTLYSSYGMDVGTLFLIGFTSSGIFSMFIGAPLRDDLARDPSHHHHHHAARAGTQGARHAPQEPRVMNSVSSLTRTM